MNKLAQGCIAEFLGTFALVFFGCLSIIVAAGEMGGQPIAGSGGLVTIALAHGLILSVGICAAMFISGAQFNPAVSFALVVAGKQTFPTAIIYTAVQLIAAASAAGMVQLLVGPEVANSPTVRLGATIGRLTDAQNFGAVLGIEAILTFALMIAVLAGTVDERAHKLGGFVIGLTVTACILAAGPLTGASMNPARTFGPAVCGGHWNMHWVYWAGPLVGASLAAVVYREVWAARTR